MKEHEYERDKSFFTLRNIGIAQDISKEAVFGLCLRGCRAY